MLKSHKNISSLVISLTLLMVADIAFAYSQAYNRALVLGRAHGMAIACNAKPEQKKEFVDLALADIRSRARDAVDLSEAELRFKLETGKTRLAINNSAFDCDRGLWFYEDQRKGLLKQKHVSKN